MLGRRSLTRVSTRSGSSPLEAAGRPLRRTELADWLREQGHDVVEVRALGRDPGDATLLRQAASERRILVPIDTDFGTLIHLRAQRHAGLIRLPDVPPAARIELMAQIFASYSEDELSRAILTVKGSRIRIARPAAGRSRTS